MGQAVSKLWETLWNTRDTRREYAFEINGVWYGPEKEVEHSVESALYEDFSIGNAYTSSITVNLYADDIPKGAKIKRFVRIVNGDTVSEWLPKGVFFASNRYDDDGYWTIKAFDSMRKADVVWEPDQTLTFPMTMANAANEFARIMGVEIDDRTVLNSSYTIDYPANEWTIRNELCFIAAAHGGNWVMTDSGKLRLISIMSIPEETNYLVNERGSAITFGGVRILV